MAWQSESSACLHWALGASAATLNASNTLHPLVITLVSHVGQAEQPNTCAHL